MDLNFDFKRSNDDRIVYIRKISKIEIPSEVQDELHDLTDLFSIHTMDGEQIAIVEQRDVAFDVAKQNEYIPMSVH